MVMKMNSNSESVLKALSSSTRRTIIRQISEKGAATYTEIMQVLGLEPTQMSGKFNYHLKELTEAGLIEKMNGEYRITDLGKKALILVDQVAEDAKVDRYGVLSAVLSMSPTKEFSLFASQMGMMVGIMLTMLFFIGALLTYDTGGILYFASVSTTLISLLLTIVFIGKMVGIVRSFRVGFSSFVFLSSNWFFIRSANRNSFFLITLFAIGAMVSGILAIVLPYSGALPLYSLEWWGLVFPAIGSSILSSYLMIRAKRRAVQMEEKANEQ